MQDYPGQLWYVEALRAHNEPGSDYDRYFEFRFHPVYATFYLTTMAFAAFVPIEIAGKLSLSLYPILVALVVLRLGRRSESTRAPWGALLFFPFAFNQQYFFGNIAYFMSLPMMILALLDYEDWLSGPGGVRAIARQAGWQIALVVTHPLSYLVFLGLALLDTLLMKRETIDVRRKVSLAAGTAVAVLAAVWVAERGTQLSGVSGLPDVAWLSPLMTFQFWSFMFDGMQSWRTADVWVLLSWACVFAIVGAAGVTAWRERPSWAFPSRHAMLLGLLVLGMFALPFQIGNYTYLNVRVAALVYFFVALCAARLPIGGLKACCLVPLLGTCMLASIAKQARLSGEASEVLTVLGKMPPNARILPLIFDPGSQELDRYWFAPHTQEYNYYHVLVGGGFNPYLLGSPVDPVRPRPGEERPAPGVMRPDRFDWEKHAADYQYFLVRGVPAGLPEFFQHYCHRVIAHGDWMLFERRS
jgi:hypothetical protein